MNAPWALLRSENYEIKSAVEMTPRADGGFISLAKDKK